MEQEKGLLVTEIADLKEKIAVAELESVARTLEGEVTRLREEKAVLEAKAPSDAPTEQMQVHVA